MDRQEQSDDTPIWAKYVGREVGIFSTNGPIVIGKMGKPNLKYGYIEFLPSLVNEPDDKHVHAESKLPTTIALHVIEDGNVIIRPLKDGYTLERAEFLNRNSDEKRNIGFNDANSKP